MMGGFYVLLFCMVLCILHPVQAVAADYTVFVPDSISDDMSAPAVYPDENIDEIELINDLATPSDVQFLATPSDFDFGGVQSLAAYNRPYDGSMSSSVINYFDDIVQKLGGVHYVFFRSGQYSYRLIYGKDMSLSGSYFSGSECSYYAYDTRYYTWQQGYEGSFSLDAESYLVYSDLGVYPALAAGSIVGWLVAFCVVLYLLYVILRALFAPQRMRY